MYVISTGRVEITLDQGDQSIVLATLGPGEFFGELSIFDSETRSATVIAVEETEAWSLGRMDIVRILNRSPDMALSLLKSISARLRVMNARLGDVTTEVQAPA
jgi:CRP-like cAMP-binding protein